MRRRGRETEDIAIHGSNNEIKVVPTIYIISQNHAISVIEQDSFFFLFLVNTQIAEA